MSLLFLQFCTYFFDVFTIPRCCCLFVAPPKYFPYKMWNHSQKPKYSQFSLRTAIECFCSGIVWLLLLRKNCRLCGNVATIYMQSDLSVGIVHKFHSGVEWPHKKRKTEKRFGCCARASKGAPIRWYGWKDDEYWKQYFDWKLSSCVSNFNILLTCWKLLLIFSWAEFFFFYF